MKKKTKKSQKYTTIQVNKDVNILIKNLCQQYGLVAAKITENYWMSLVTASLSGSLSV